MRQWTEQAKALILAYANGRITLDQFYDALKDAYKKQSLNAYMAGRRAVGNLSAPSVTALATWQTLIAPDVAALGAEQTAAGAAPAGGGGGSMSSLITSQFMPQNFIGSGLPGDPLNSIIPGNAMFPSEKPTNAAERALANRIEAYGRNIGSMASPGEMSAFTDMGIPDDALIVWWELGASDHCIDCIQLADLSPFTEQALLDSGVFPGSGHTRCLVAGTPVAGALTGGYRMRYQGKVVEVETASGHRLAVTPGHPVATSEGFRPAGTLQKGDQLVCDPPEVEGRTGGPPLAVEEDDAPATAEEVFEALLAADAVGPGRMPHVGPEDFHGDAGLFDGDVEVVGSARHLLGHRHVACPKCGSKVVLVPAAEAKRLLGGQGTTVGLVDRDPGGVSGSPRRTEVPHDLLGSASGPDGGLRRGRIAKSDARLAQPAGESRSADADFLRELLQADPALVSLDEVVEVREVDYSGHVFDFSTHMGAYIAGGVLVSNCGHNCNCSLNYDVPSEVCGDSLSDAGSAADVGEAAYPEAQPFPFFESNDGRRLNVWVQEAASCDLPIDVSAFNGEGEFDEIDDEDAFDFDEDLALQIVGGLDEDSLALLDDMMDDPAVASMFGWLDDVVEAGAMEKARITTYALPNLGVDYRFVWHETADSVVFDVGITTKGATTLDPEMTMKAIADLAARAQTEGKGLVINGQTAGTGMKRWLDALSTDRRMAGGGPATVVPRWDVLPAPLSRPTITTRLPEVDALGVPPPPQNLAVIVHKGKAEKATTVIPGTANPLGGYSPKTLVTDMQGNEYLVKHGTAGPWEEAASTIHADLGMRVSPAYATPGSDLFDAGSIQTIVKHTSALDETKPVEEFARLTPEQAREVNRQSVLDMLLANDDAHAGQFLIDDEGRLWGIDKGLSFRDIGNQYTANSSYFWLRAPSGVNYPGVFYGEAVRHPGQSHILELLTPQDVQEALDRVYAIPVDDLIVKANGALDYVQRVHGGDWIPREEAEAALRQRYAALRSSYEDLYRHVVNNDPYYLSEYLDVAANPPLNVPQVWKDWAAAGGHFGPTEERVIASTAPLLKSSSLDDATLAAGLDRWAQDSGPIQARLLGHEVESHASTATIDGWIENIDSVMAGARRHEEVTVSRGIQPTGHYDNLFVNGGINPDTGLYEEFNGGFIGNGMFANVTGDGLLRPTNEKEFFDSIGSLVGTELPVDPRFLSTSIGEMPPSEFADSVHSVVLRMKVPDGVGAVRVDTGLHASEGEVLVDRGQRIRITGATRTKAKDAWSGKEYDRWVLDAEVIPPPVRRAEDGATAVVDVMTPVGMKAVDPLAGKRVWADFDDMIADLTARYPGADFEDLRLLDFHMATVAMNDMDVTIGRFGTEGFVFKGVKAPPKGGNVIAEVKRVKKDEPGSAIFLYQDWWGKPGRFDHLVKGPGAKVYGIDEHGVTADEVAAAILTHEMGHEYMGLHLYSRFGVKGDEVRAEVDAWFKKYQTTFRKDAISEYSKKNEHEAWAEAFTGAIGPENVRSNDPRIVELRGILDRYYPEAVAVPDAAVVVPQAKAIDEVLARIDTAPPFTSVGEAEWVGNTAPLPKMGTPGFAKVEYKPAALLGKPKQQMAYVWYDEKGELAASAVIETLPGGGRRINNVITRPDLRGKGYASMLYDRIYADEGQEFLDSLAKGAMSPEGKGFLRKWLLSKKVAVAPDEAVVPDITTLTPHATGLGGKAKKVAYTDATGQEWLFKQGAGTMVGDVPVEAAAKAEAAASRIGKALDMNVVPVTAAQDAAGKWGSLQPIVATKPLPMEAGLDTLTEQQARELARQHVLDRLIGNFDSTAQNWELGADGSLLGLDKGYGIVGVVAQGATGHLADVTTEFGMWSEVLKRPALLAKVHPVDVGSAIRRVEQMTDVEYLDLIGQDTITALTKGKYGFGATKVSPTETQVRQWLLTRKHSIRSDEREWWTAGLKKVDTKDLPPDWQAWLDAKGAFPSGAVYAGAPTVPLVPVAAKVVMPDPPYASLLPAAMRATPTEPSSIGTDRATWQVGFKKPVSREQTLERIGDITTGTIHVDGLSDDQLVDVLARLELMYDLGFDTDRVRIVDFAKATAQEKVDMVTLSKGHSIAVNPDVKWYAFGANTARPTAYDDLGGAVAHEYGAVLLTDMSKDAKKSVQAIYDANKDVFVSDYAAQDFDSWFGEVIATVTRPGYKRGTLPYDDDLYKVLGDDGLLKKAPVLEPVGPPVALTGEVGLKQGDPQMYLVGGNDLPLNAPLAEWTGATVTEPALPAEVLKATPEELAAKKAASDAAWKDWHDVASGKVKVALSNNPADATEAQQAGLIYENVNGTRLIASDQTAMNEAKAWLSTPGHSASSDEFWLEVLGYDQKDLDAIDAYEAAKKGKRLSAGVVIVEPDGRVWVMAPKNEWAGYRNTWSKGGVDAGETAAEAAVRELREEMGFSVELDSFLGDYMNTDKTGITRMYIGHRTGGGPLYAHPKETYKVRLLTQEEAQKALVRYNKPDARDQTILADAFAALNPKADTANYVIKPDEVGEFAQKLRPAPAREMAMAPKPVQFMAPSAVDAKPLSASFGYDKATVDSYLGTQSVSPPGTTFPMYTTRWKTTTGETQSCYHRIDDITTEGGAEAKRIFWANSKKQVLDPNLRYNIHVAQLRSHLEEMAGDQTITSLRVNDALLDNVPQLRDLLTAAGATAPTPGTLELSAAKAQVLLDKLTNDLPLDPPGSVVSIATAPMVPGAVTVAASGTYEVEPVGDLLAKVVLDDSAIVWGKQQKMKWLDGWVTNWEFENSASMSISGFVPDGIATAQAHHTVVANLASVGHMLKTHPDVGGISEVWLADSMLVPGPSTDALMAHLGAQKLGGAWLIKPERLKEFSDEVTLELGSAGVPLGEGMTHVWAATIPTPTIPTTELSATYHYDVGQVAQVKFSSAGYEEEGGIPGFNAIWTLNGSQVETHFRSANGELRWHAQRLKKWGVGSTESGYGIRSTKWLGDVMELNPELTVFAADKAALAKSGGVVRKMLLDAGGVEDATGTVRLTRDQMLALRDRIAKEFPSPIVSVPNDTLPNFLGYKVDDVLAAFPGSPVKHPTDALSLDGPGGWQMFYHLDCHHVMGGAPHTLVIGDMTGLTSLAHEQKTARWIAGLANLPTTGVDRYLISPGARMPSDLKAALLASGAEVTADYVSLSPKVLQDFVHRALTEASTAATEAAQAAKVVAAVSEAIPTAEKASEAVVALLAAVDTKVKGVQGIADNFTRSAYGSDGIVTWRRLGNTMEANETEALGSAGFTSHIARMADAFTAAPKVQFLRFTQPCVDSLDPALRQVLIDAGAKVYAGGIKLEREQLFALRDTLLAHVDNLGAEANAEAMQKAKFLVTEVVGKKPAAIDTLAYQFNFDPIEALNPDGIAYHFWAPKGEVTPWTLNGTTLYVDRHVPGRTTIESISLAEDVTTKERQTAGFGMLRGVLQNGPAKHPLGEDVLVHREFLDAIPGTDTFLLHNGGEAVADASGYMEGVLVKKESIEKVLAAMDEGKPVPVGMFAPEEKVATIVAQAPEVVAPVAPAATLLSEYGLDPASVKALSVELVPQKQHFRKFVFHHPTAEQDVSVRVRYLKSEIVWDAVGGSPVEAYRVDATLRAICELADAMEHDPEAIAAQRIRFMFLDKVPQQTKQVLLDAGAMTEGDVLYLERANVLELAKGIRGEAFTPLKNVVVPVEKGITDPGLCAVASTTAEEVGAVVVKQGPLHDGLMMWDLGANANFAPMAAFVSVPPDSGLVILASTTDNLGGAGLLAAVNAMAKDVVDGKYAEFRVKMPVLKGAQGAAVKKALLDAGAVEDGEVLVVSGKELASHVVESITNDIPVAPIIGLPPPTTSVDTVGATFAAQYGLKPGELASVEWTGEFNDILDDIYVALPGGPKMDVWYEPYYRGDGWQVRAPVPAESSNALSLAVVQKVQADWPKFGGSEVTLKRLSPDVENALLAAGATPGPLGIGGAGVVISRSDLDAFVAQHLDEGIAQSAKPLVGSAALNLPEPTPTISEVLGLTDGQMDTASKWLSEHSTITGPIEPESGVVTGTTYYSRTLHVGAGNNEQQVEFAMYVPEGTTKPTELRIREFIWTPNLPVEDKWGIDAHLIERIDKQFISGGGNYESIEKVTLAFTAEAQEKERLVPLMKKFGATADPDGRLSMTVAQWHDMRVALDQQMAELPEVVTKTASDAVAAVSDNPWKAVMLGPGGDWVPAGGLKKAGSTQFNGEVLQAVYYPSGTAASVENLLPNQHGMLVMWSPLAADPANEVGTPTAWLAACIAKGGQPPTGENLAQARAAALADFVHGAAVNDRSVFISKGYFGSDMPQYEALINSLPSGSVLPVSGGQYTAFEGDAGWFINASGVKQLESKLQGGLDVNPLDFVAPIVPVEKKVLAYDTKVVDTLVDANDSLILTPGTPLTGGFYFKALTDPATADDIGSMKWTLLPKYEAAAYMLPTTSDIVWVSSLDGPDAATVSLALMGAVKAKTTHSGMAFDAVLFDPEHAGPGMYKALLDAGATKVLGSDNLYLAPEKVDTFVNGLLHKSLDGVEKPKVGGQAQATADAAKAAATVTPPSFAPDPAKVMDSWLDTPTITVDPGFKTASGFQKDVRIGTDHVAVFHYDISPLTGNLTLNDILLPANDTARITPLLVTAQEAWNQKVGLLIDAHVFEPEQGGLALKSLVLNAGGISASDGAVWVAHDSLDSFMHSLSDESALKDLLGFSGLAAPPPAAPTGLAYDPAKAWHAFIDQPSLVVEPGYEIDVNVFQKYIYLSADDVKHNNPSAMLSYDADPMGILVNGINSPTNNESLVVSALYAADLAGVQDKDVIFHAACFEDDSGGSAFKELLKAAGATEDASGSLYLPSSNIDEFVAFLKSGGQAAPTPAPAAAVAAAPVTQTFIPKYLYDTSGADIHKVYATVAIENKPQKFFELTTTGVDGSKTTSRFRMSAQTITWKEKASDVKLSSVDEWARILGIGDILDNSPTVGKVVIEKPGLLTLPTVNALKDAGAVMDGTTLVVTRDQWNHVRNAIVHDLSGAPQAAHVASQAGSAAYTAINYADVLSKAGFMTTDYGGPMVAYQVAGTKVAWSLKGSYVGVLPEQFGEFNDLLLLDHIASGANDNYAAENLLAVIANHGLEGKEYGAYQPMVFGKSLLDEVPQFADLMKPYGTILPDGALFVDSEMMKSVASALADGMPLPPVGRIPVKWKTYASAPDTVTAAVAAANHGYGNFDATFTFEGKKFWASINADAGGTVTITGFSWPKGSATEAESLDAQKAIIVALTKSVSDNGGTFWVDDMAWDSGSALDTWLHDIVKAKPQHTGDIGVSLSFTPEAFESVGSVAAVAANPSSGTFTKALGDLLAHDSTNKSAQTTLKSVANGTSGAGVHNIWPPHQTQVHLEFAHDPTTGNLIIKSFDAYQPEDPLDVAMAVGLILDSAGGNVIWSPEAVNALGPSGALKALGHLDIGPKGLTSHITADDFWDAVPKPDVVAYGKVKQANELLLDTAVQPHPEVPSVVWSVDGSPLGSLVTTSGAGTINITKVDLPPGQEDLAVDLFAAMYQKNFFQTSGMVAFTGDGKAWVEANLSSEWLVNPSGDVVYLNGIKAQNWAGKAGRAPGVAAPTPSPTADLWSKAMSDAYDAGTGEIHVNLSGFDVMFTKSPQGNVVLFDAPGITSGEAAQNLAKAMKDLADSKGVKVTLNHQTVDPGVLDAVVAGGGTKNPTTHYWQFAPEAKPVGASGVPTGQTLADAADDFWAGAVSGKGSSKKGLIVDQHGHVTGLSGEAAKDPVLALWGAAKKAQEEGFTVKVEKGLSPVLDDFATKMGLAYDENDWILNSVTFEMMVAKSVPVPPPAALSTFEAANPTLVSSIGDLVAQTTKVGNNQFSDDLHVAFSSGHNAADIQLAVTLTPNGQKYLVLNTLTLSVANDEADMAELLDNIAAIAAKHNLKPAVNTGYAGANLKTMLGEQFDLTTFVPTYASWMEYTWKGAAAAPAIPLDSSTLATHIVGAATSGKKFVAPNGFVISPGASGVVYLKEFVATTPEDVAAVKAAAQGAANSLHSAVGIATDQSDALDAIMASQGANPTMGYWMFTPGVAPAVAKPAAPALHQTLGWDISHIGDMKAPPAQAKDWATKKTGTYGIVDKSVTGYSPGYGGTAAQQLRFEYSDFKARVLVKRKVNAQNGTAEQWEAATWEALRVFGKRAVDSDKPLTVLDSLDPSGKVKTLLQQFGGKKKALADGDAWELTPAEAKKMVEALAESKSTITGIAPGTPWTVVSGVGSGAADGIVAKKMAETGGWVTTELEDADGVLKAKLSISNTYEGKTVIDIGFAANVTAEEKAALLYDVLVAAKAQGKEVSFTSNIIKTLGLDADPNWVGSGTTYAMKYAPADMEQAIKQVDAIKSALPVPAGAAPTPPPPPPPPKPWGHSDFIANNYIGVPHGGFTDALDSTAGASQTFIYKGKSNMPWATVKYEVDPGGGWLRVDTVFAPDATAEAKSAVLGDVVQSAEAKGLTVVHTDASLAQVGITDDLGGLLVWDADAQGWMAWDQKKFSDILLQKQAKPAGGGPLIPPALEAPPEVAASIVTPPSGLGDAYGYTAANATDLVKGMSDQTKPSVVTALISDSKTAKVYEDTWTNGVVVKWAEEVQVDKRVLRVRGFSGGVGATQSDALVAELMARLPAHLDKNPDLSRVLINKSALTDKPGIEKMLHDAGWKETKDYWVLDRTKVGDLSKALADDKADWMSVTAIASAAPGTTTLPPALTPGFLYGYDSTAMAHAYGAMTDEVVQDTSGILIDGKPVKAGSTVHRVRIGGTEALTSTSPSGKTVGWADLKFAAGTTQQQQMDEAFAILRKVAEDAEGKEGYFWVSPAVYDSVPGMRQLLIDAGGEEHSWPNLGTVIRMDASKMQPLAQAMASNSMAGLTVDIKATSDYLIYNAKKASELFNANPVDKGKGLFVWQTATGSGSNAKTGVRIARSADGKVSEIRAIEGTSSMFPLALVAQVNWLVEQGTNDLLFTNDVLAQVPKLRNYLMAAGATTEAGGMRLAGQNLVIARVMLTKDGLPQFLGGAPVKLGIFDGLMTSTQKVATATLAQKQMAKATDDVASFLLNGHELRYAYTKGNGAIYWKSIDVGTGTVAEQRSATAAQLRSFLNTMGQDASVKSLDFDAKMLADHPNLTAVLKKYGAVEVPGASGNGPFLRLERSKAMRLRKDIEKEMSTHGTGTQAGGTFIEQQAASIVWPVAEDLTLVPNVKKAGQTTKYVFTDADGNQWLFKPGASGRGAETDKAIAELAEVLGLPVPPVRVYTLEVPGQGALSGSLQKMVPNLKMDGVHDVHALSPEQTQELWRHEVLDWLIANDDSHIDNFIVDADGHLWAIDKTRSFESLNDGRQDVLSTLNNGQGGARQPPLFYQFWRDARDDPTLLTRVHPQTMSKTLRSVRDMDDDLYLRIVGGIAPLTRNPKYAGKPDAMLKAMLDRKHSVSTDLESYIAGELQTIKKSGGAIPKEWDDWLKAGGHFNLDQTPQDLAVQRLAELEQSYGKYTPQRFEQLAHQGNFDKVNSKLRTYYNTVGSSGHYDAEKIPPAVGIAVADEWARLQEWAVLTILTDPTASTSEGTAWAERLRKYYNPDTGKIRVVRSTNRYKRAGRADIPEAYWDGYNAEGIRMLIGSSIGKETVVQASGGVYVYYDIDPAQVFSYWGIGGYGLGGGEAEVMIYNPRIDQIVAIASQRNPIPMSQLMTYNGPVIVK